MDSEKGNRVFARGAQCAPPPPLVFGAKKKPGLDRVKSVVASGTNIVPRFSASNYYCSLGASWEKGLM